MEILSNLRELLRRELKSGYLVKILEKEGRIEITIGVANPALHFKKKVEAEAREIVKKAGIDVPLSFVFVYTGAESGSQTGSAPAGNVKLKKDIVKGIKYIIGVGAGKGGVGKSTVAVNMAVCMSLEGYRVGLLDADIYGPSVPLLLGIEERQLRVIEKNGKKYIEPIVTLGVKVVSIGLFGDKEQPVPWRGPMASNAVMQLVHDVDWGELDFLIVDLPPGTGDIHLTFAQQIGMSGVIVVTTPQKVATADVIRAVKMFQMRNVEVPVLGIVENLSWFSPADAPEKKYYIFGKGGGKEVAEKFGIPLLGQIPMMEEIVEGGDNGMPAATLGSPIVMRPYQALVLNMVRRIQELEST